MNTVVVEKRLLVQACQVPFDDCTAGGERVAPPPVVRSGWIRRAGAPADGDQDR